ncbi:MAG TPA: rRNA maturation RNAse YbeY, partial [Bacillota bacterium]|nr:rRNA maturation RNAse YbeY [Bacillota bacterium]
MPTLLNNIQTQSSLSEPQLGLVTAVLDFGLARFEKTAAEVSLVLVDNDYIRELNLEYRGLDQPTD